MSDVDKVLADEVRARAHELASAMNRAGKAGLQIKQEIRPHNFETLPNGDQKCTGYVVYVSVWRTSHC